MTCICVSKTGLIVSGSGDKTIAYWNLFNQDGTDHETALNLSKTLTGTFLAPIGAQGVTMSVRLSVR